ncbi:glycosyltransferase [Candidatus Woesebacteria bacterium]|nr:MAG: glycosyltransferase [Candidatus Woesebacteria bacterium]
MRILMVTATYAPSINGIAIAISNLKSSLESFGHEVTILAPNNPNVTKEEKGVIRYPSLENPVVKDYPIPLAPGPKSLAKLLSGYEPDIIHVHHPLHIGGMARLLALRFKVPLVFTYHTRYDLYAKKYVKFLPNSLREMFYGNRIDKFCKNVDLIIAPSNYIQKSLLKKFPYQEVVAIPSGVSKLTTSDNKALSLKEKLSIGNSKTVLLTVGRVAREKNQEVLIHAMKHLNDDFVLIIAGDGPSRSSLEHLAGKLGVEERVIFAGRIEHSLIGAYYEIADCFVYSSTTETQGIIFLEALSHGLPIVSVKSSASLEWVKSEVGYQTESKPNLIAESITKITKGDRENFAQQARKIASDFTSEKMSQKLLDEYERLLKNKKFYSELTATGWQSWSTKPKGLVKFPIRNFAPSGKMFLPETKTIKTGKKPIVGWSSWYAYWWKINEKKIIDQTKWFSQHSEIPVEFIVIDDGWTRWGDWENENIKRFPNGVGTVSKKIKKLGFKPGIWLAPFLVDPRSELAKKHPEYLVRYNNKLVEGMKVTSFDRFIFPKYILDIRKKEVRKHLVNSIRKLVINDGFELLKLDYLYAPFFIPGVGMHEAGYYLNKFLLNVKKMYPQVYTIASGCPFAPALGVVDAMRICPDISIPFIDNIPLVSSIYHKRKLLLSKGNIKNRANMKKHWNINTDSYVCRKSLRVNNKILLQFAKEIKHMDSDILLGDDFTRLEKERIDKLILPLFVK